ncbi:MAG: YgiQ family radical SAM protein [Paludibacteraceae bacterium]|nr:YgiQ family radical SAM protein [Paludibacteraceae bacterium]
MLTDFLPTTKKEIELRGWDYIDVILFSGDAYVDHPSFGAAVIGRTLESVGLRVAIVPQPDWHGDHRDFLKLGTPRLFFAISAGSMDSMVNHYTANRRRRSDDAYTPDGRAGMRPDYCTITYARIIKQHFPDVPLVIGGIEASMRRLAHYDYWSDRLMPSILVDSGADLLIYGMGEKPVKAVAGHYARTKAVPTNIPQTAFLLNSQKPLTVDNTIVLHSYEQCLRDKRCQAENFRYIEEQSNSLHSHTLCQLTGSSCVVVLPPYPPMTTEEIDASFDLPYTRLPHPKYKGKTIPAYDMIRFSVCMHRGCFGGCAFCTISAHQGKHVSSRSKNSIMQEIEKISQLPDFKGYLSDLGGPSANMYMMNGKDQSLCERCHRPSCIQPSVCKNLNADFAPLLDIYRSVDRLPYIKKAFVGSGIRYDLVSEEYIREVIKRHVSGRLKVAPEHTEASVLRLMRKPDFELFERFNNFFEQVNREEGLNQQLIPYFISSHPGCTMEDMAQLALKTKRMNFHLEQVQDFTPTPMTLATEMYYTGINPYTMKPVFVARSKEQKLEQRQFFFWYKKEYAAAIRNSLKRIHRDDLAQKLLAKK